MGSYNCKECIERDINNTNELLINKAFFSSDLNNEYNPRDERLKLEKESENNVVNNLEINSSLRQKLLLKKSNNENEKNQNYLNYLQKEERENNILLKNELNKIKNINNIESNNSVKNNEDIKENESKEENNENNDIKNELIISEEISKEQQKKINQQKEQILNQQKLIEQYEKQQLYYEQQKLQLQEAQLKIQQQLSQLQGLESPDFDAHSQNQEKIVEYSPKFIQNKTPNHQQVQSAKTSPSPILKKINLNQQLEDKIQDQIQEKDKEIEKQKVGLNPNNQKSGQTDEQEKENQNEDNQRENGHEGDNQEEDNQDEDNQEEDNQNEDNQGEEIYGYEKVDDLDEIDDKDANYYHSQKFKIETYEPIEQGTKNENSDNYDISENYENENINKGKDIHSKKEKSLEPEDNLQLEKRKPMILKTNNKNKSFYELIKKREDGPKDSGKKNVNFKDKETFKKEREKNREFLLKMKIREEGPRDSKKKLKEYQKENNENEDQDGNKPIISNQPAAYIGQKNNISNPIDGSISKVILNNNNYNTGINQNNFNNNANFQTNYNFVNNGIISSLQLPQQYINQNNIYIPQEMDLNQQIIDSQNLEIYNVGDNEIKNEMQQYRNAATFGPYINEIDQFNVAMSADPVIHHNDNKFERYPSYNNPNEQIQTNSSSYVYNVNGNEGTLVYNVNMENMNY